MVGEAGGRPGNARGPRDPRGVRRARGVARARSPRRAARNLDRSVQTRPQPVQARPQHPLLLVQRRRVEGTPTDRPGPVPPRRADPRAGLDRGTRPDGGRRVVHPARQGPPRAPRVVLGGRQRSVGAVARRPARRHSRGNATTVPVPRSARGGAPGGRRDGARGGWRLGLGGWAHGHGTAAHLPRRPRRARQRADRNDLSAPRPADPPPRSLDHHPGLAGRGRAGDLVASRRDLGSGDPARIRGARPPCIRITRRAPIAGTAPGRARGARGGDGRSAGGRTPAQGRRPPAGRDAAGAASARQGLWARRLGRPAPHRDVVLPLVSRRGPRPHDQPPATGRARGLHHVARRALRGPRVAGDRGRYRGSSRRRAGPGGRGSSHPGARPRRGVRRVARRPVACGLRDAPGRDRSRGSGRSTDRRRGGRVGADRRLPGGKRKCHAAGAARGSCPPPGDDGADHRRRAGGCPRRWRPSVPTG